jgi:hypothetical protein
MSQGRWPFYTTTMAAIATNGGVAGIAVPALNRFEMQNETTSVIIYNPHATNVLYVIPYNTVTDAAGGVAVANCIPITAGSYLTLSLGTRTERVGTEFFTGITTAAASFDFTVTEIYNASE